MKYIGIRGHRGAGKNTISFLLACTLEYLASKQNEQEFEQAFNEWCEDFRCNENLINELDCKHVIIEGFGDAPKMLLSMLTGISTSDMNDDWAKDHTVINLKDFSRSQYTDPKEQFGTELVSAHEYFLETVSSTEPEAITQNVYMTLRELILYFGIYVMQNAFGMNVWIKSLIANASWWQGLWPDDGDTDFKIYNDIKAKTEITYIKDKGGVIIKVSRPGHRKHGGMDLLRGDNRHDYEIVINGPLEDLRDQILNIAKQIINE